AARFAGSYGAWLRERAGGSGGGKRVTVVIGRDGRAGGDQIQSAAIKGLTAAGCAVIDLGVAMTPTIAVMTASYPPPPRPPTPASAGPRAPRRRLHRPGRPPPPPHPGQAPPLRPPPRPHRPGRGHGRPRQPQPPAMERPQVPARRGRRVRLRGLRTARCVCRP